MKIYRRNPLHENILFEDQIIIDIDIDITDMIAASYSPISKFPGVDNFRKEVLSILENDYHFDVIASEHNGILQKGYCSNRDQSASIYFDTYYDLNNAEEPISRLGATITTPISGNVYCFIHFRISDHYPNDANSIEHRQFLHDTIQKHVANRSDVSDAYEADIVIDEYTMQLHYDEALDELRDMLDAHILGWVRRAERHYK